jgi:hypothetical protein
MVALIIGMLVCVGLAVAVVALVAVPARREGRDLLSPEGEEIMASAREMTGSAIERTGDAIANAKDRVTDSMGSAPSGSEDVGRHRAS